MSLSFQSIIAQLHEFWSDRIVSQLNRCAPVSSRAMFGGYGLYQDGVMFALIAESTLYFKVDESNLADFQAANMQPFTYWRGDRAIVMSYYRLPDEVFANVEVLAQWLAKSYEIARRSKSKRVKKTKKRDSFR